MNDEISVLNKIDYPETLKNMRGSPRKLYIRGRLSSSQDQKYLCVIGSRLFTPYGRDSVYKLLRGIQGYPISIVSGLAIGIDSIAHEAALEFDLHCVAFPGSTLDWNAIYPTTHTALARKIVDSGGALLSKWNIGYEMGKWAFPERNKLMAGISHATLIIEAAQHSGSLMTVEHAEEYSRDVYAVPGPISSKNTYGPHMLIKRGAVMVTESEDILEALGFDVPANKKARSKNIERLDDLSKKIFESVSLYEMTADALAERCEAPIPQINISLSILELEGLIKSENGIIKLA